ncbi:uncharacterized protein ISCGN_007266 [Ixodes scapularis]
MPVVSLFSLDNMAAPPVAPCSEEALIQEVERYPWLWNASRMDYRDTAKRDNSWKAIGIALGSDSNACCQAWRALRAKYARESKKQSGRSGAGRDDVPATTWHLFKYLAFLKGQIQHRRTRVLPVARGVASTSAAAAEAEKSGMTPRALLMEAYSPQEEDEDSLGF